MLDHSSFRRIVIVLLVLAGLGAPLRTVFACQLMDGRKQYVCCCHEEGHCKHGGGCPHRKPEGPTGCCDVAHEIADDGLASAPADHVFQVLLLEAPRPPPAAPTPSIALLQPPPLPNPRWRADPPAWCAGSRTYLVTQRFRI
ncbi:hypothetical protein [Methylohalobius crimeensis]|uniref:hypothetical protein n=1 Tax=Methylohalobius crimeensis TaxID=244365 RepID=UPI0012685D32|nr:hypothetical protein [Methylohalobius crimeensis]